MVVSFLELTFINIIVQEDNRLSIIQFLHYCISVLVKITSLIALQVFYSIVPNSLE